MRRLWKKIKQIKHPLPRSGLHIVGSFFLQVCSPLNSRFGGISFSSGYFQFLLNEMGGFWAFDWYLVCRAGIFLPEKRHWTIKDCLWQPWWHFWEPQQHSQQLHAPPPWRVKPSLTIMEGGMISKVIIIFLCRRTLSSFLFTHQTYLLFTYPRVGLMIFRTSVPSLGWREILLE